MKRMLDLGAGGGHTKITNQEIWQNWAIELNKEAFLSVAEESFPPHLSGLEKNSPLQSITCVIVFPLARVASETPAERGKHQPKRICPN